ncbi:mitochondrial adenyl nucleotide antiporter SLC25A24-like isoform X3 [Petaurus breviceps papuanus]|uniref:mitochondrial adenyl nucleotide antiporter SLC25A24-like isoform X3 n=1 Tax=Petaurus breviceps papuanus TaxID=3040969 RepID=UPI0036D8175D
MIAGAISRTCTAPLERLKVRMQAQVLPPATITLKSGFETMLREGGIFSLWKGNYVNVLKIAPETSIKYWSYEKYKNLLATERATIGIMDRFVSGSLAGITAQTLVYPLELLKNFWLQHHSRDSVNPGIVVLLACSTLSSTCGQLASYPFTLVRTRMQAEEILRGIQPMKMIRLAKIIIVTEGMMGFYKGIIPNVVKVLPAVCISYGIYEKTRKSLGVADV